MSAEISSPGLLQIEAWTKTLSNWISEKELESYQKKHRLAVYRELIRNNIESFLIPVFPIARTLISEAMWEEWVAEFLQSPYRTSPLFRNIAENFLVMLANFPVSRLSPALLQLMRWEWIEMAVAINSAKILRSINGQTLNPSLRIELFDYPVHMIAREGKLLPAQSTVLLAWRDCENNVEAICPDETMLQLILHLASCEEDEQQAHDTWQIITATPSLMQLSQILREKEILL
ncbi:MAG: putative DNA-binding domain-containing protein [Pseudomonadota bacterium]